MALQSFGLFFFEKIISQNFSTTTYKCDISKFQELKGLSEKNILKKNFRRKIFSGVVLRFKIEISKSTTPRNFSKIFLKCDPFH